MNCKLRQRISIDMNCLLSSLKVQNRSNAWREVRGYTHNDEFVDKFQKEMCYSVECFNRKFEINYECLHLLLDKHREVKLCDCMLRHLNCGATFMMWLELAIHSLSLLNSLLRPLQFINLSLCAGGIVKEWCDREALFVLAKDYKFLLLFPVVECITIHSGNVECWLLFSP